MTRRAPIVALLLPLAAAGPAGFRPGLWQVTSAPTGASLDGRPLTDLPYAGPAGPGTVCLSAADAPGLGWVTRDLAPGCTITRGALGGDGRVAVTASCPPQAPGLARGTVRLTGRWTPTGYDLRFATTNPSETGVMGFTGTMTGRRTGDCPTPPPRP
ncbi:DUF3617 domain-containing protein [uncultured Sphingomonas sp.]|uniref:DUF3617 domain-containing protein n=1 Tax=uncultured Sphingomonas sp. TaxID=158754 RepID=UPI0035CA2047